MSVRKVHFRLSLLLGYLLPFVLLAAVYASAPIKFAVLGDMPYRNEDIAGYEKLIDRINQEKPDWVVYVGDTKNGSTSCANEAYMPIIRWFDRYTPPLIYTPGDNEWTDCHRITAGRFDPNERLKWVRTEFFQKPHGWAKSLKTTAQRPPLIENQYWFREGVMFATLHVVGSQNHFSEDHSPNSEWAVRNNNNLNWLKWIFFEAKNKQSPMIVLFWHGDPLFESPAKDRPGYQALIEVLTKQVRDFPGDVVLIHGDRHRFVIDKPLPLQDFTRVITYGDRDLFALLFRLNQAQGTLEISPLGGQEKYNSKTIKNKTIKLHSFKHSKDRISKKVSSHAF
ncbi:MAG: metallophosphoesterase [Cyanobacteria bacterium]|nr:metallophosphoesterase [Cyanobacteriota bacterium]